MKSILPVTLVFLELSVFPAMGRMGRLTLNDLWQTSELVVIAQIEVVDEEFKSEHRIAHARIENVLKGSIVGGSVRYIASPTWACDVSDSQPEERVLLFLEHSSRFGQYVISGSGRGHLRILTIEGKRFCRVYYGLNLPESVSRYRVQGGPMASEWHCWMLADFDPLMDFLENTLQ